MGSYSEYQPSAELEPFVHCIWSYQTNELESTHTIVPDGRPELILHLAEPYREAEEACAQPNILFAGQLTRPLKIVPSAPTDLLAVRFRPDGARHFLGRDLDWATDKRLDLQALHGPDARALIEQVANISGTDDRLSILNQYLHSKLADHEPDTVVRNAVDSILDGTKAARPHDVQARQFQGRFKREVGISERMFSSIRRFRSVFDRLEAHADESWVMRALETGYFDQPQLARDFQRFLGCSARTWIRETTGLALALGKTDG